MNLRCRLELTPRTPDKARGRVKVSRCDNDEGRHTWTVHVDGRCVADVDTRRDALAFARVEREQLRRVVTP